MKKLIIVGATLFLVALAGCGKTDNTGSVAPFFPYQAFAPVGTNPSITCGPGQIPFETICTSAATFAQDCVYQLGGSITTVNGASVCRFSSRPTSLSFTNALLNPSPLGGNPVVVPGLPYPKKGDLLQVSTSGGGWGTTNQSQGSILWGLIHYTTTTLSCSTVNLDGVSNGNIVENEGEIAGLLATDGTSAYVIGSSAAVTIANANPTFQPLRFGLNVPANTLTLWCGSANLTVQLTRCEDLSGNTYTCQ